MIDEEMDKNDLNLTRCYAILFALCVFGGIWAFSHIGYALMTLAFVVVLPMLIYRWILLTDGHERKEKRRTTNDI